MEKKELFIGVITLLVGYLLVDYVKYEERPIVEVENGFLRGVISYTTELSAQYKGFYGIPYAEPPVGHLRFEPPEPAQNWSGIKDAGSYGPQCIQTEILWTGWTFGKEDCLYLNVMVPLPVTPSLTPLSTMIFVHGGYWHEGAAQDHGERRLMNEGIILVTFNYRLGALGFLSTGDGVVRGNQGLKDQNLAFRWVQKNIGAFGGDPKKVTIFGESAGAVSVHMHILSPSSNRLFGRAISQSGTALNLFATNTHAEVTAQSKRFAGKFGCPIKNTKEMVECLKALDATTLVSAHIESLDQFNRNRLNMFAPTIEVINDEHAFLTEDPLTTLKNGNFPKIPWIVGVNEAEGLFGSAAIFTNKTKKDLVTKKWKTGFPSYFWYKRDDQLTTKIRDYYFSQSITEEEFAKNITNSLSARAFYHPLSRAVKLYAKHAETYLYYFNYTTFYSLGHIFGESQSNLPTLNILSNIGWRLVQEFILQWPVMVNHTCHGDELPLLFTLPWSPYFTHMLPERDNVVAKHLIRTWTSFAKSWDTLMYDDVEWKPVNVTSKLPFRYLEISQNPRMINEPFTAEVEFWESINKDLLKGRT